MVGGSVRRVFCGAAAAAAVAALALACGGPAGLARSSTVNRYLPWHATQLDRDGNLAPWYRPRSGLGYDEVLRLGWRFVERSVPVDRRTGRRVYLNFAVFDPHTHKGVYWQHDPAELYASFVDSLLPWFAYSGDRRAIAIVREMLDYQLAHGTTPSRWSWPGVPFATSCAGDVDYGHCLAGMPHRFYGGIEPDKIGLLGLGYARFYELTGERRYLRAALSSATALASHVRAGDTNHSPWSFRIDARTGRTLEHADYGGMVVAPIRLFDELIRLHEGDIVSFTHARNLAWRWLLRYPLNPHSSDFNRWSGHYEDIDYDADDLNQATPVMTALYLLEHPAPESIDAAWRLHARRLLTWVRSYLGQGPYQGAWAIDEQRRPGKGEFACCSPAGLGSDTARWAAATLLLGTRTHNPAAQSTARRSLAYATYFMRSDGAVSCCGAGYPQSFWFSDGYADYLKSFNWALAADPALAPSGENHLLASTSVVQSIAYEPRRIVYRTFAGNAVETLRLSFVPTRVLADGRELPHRQDVRREGFAVQRLAGQGAVLRLRHDRARSVVIS